MTEKHKLIIEAELNYRADIQTKLVAALPHLEKGIKNLQKELATAIEHRDKLLKQFDNNEFEDLGKFLEYYNRK